MAALVLPCFFKLGLAAGLMTKSNPVSNLVYTGLRSRPQREFMEGGHDYGELRKYEYAPEATDIPSVYP